MRTLVSTIARDSTNNDLYIGSDGNLAMVYGKDAYAQIINAKMKTALGELQLNVNSGLPYFQTVFSDPDLASVWESEAIRMLSELPFVLDIQSFDYDIEENMIKYTATILTDEGVIVSNG